MPLRHSLSTTRLRMAGLFFCVFVFQVIIAAAVQHWLVAPTFDDVEGDLVVADAGNLRFLLDEELDNVGEFCRDWSHWDDMVAFLAVPSQAFIDSTLSEAGTETADIDALGVYDSNGRVVLADSFRNLRAAHDQVLATLAQDATLHRFLFNLPDVRLGASRDYQFRQWWAFQDRVQMLAFCPVVRTSDDPVIYGWLLLIRSLAAEEVAHISSRARQVFDVQAETGNSTPYQMVAGQPYPLWSRHIEAGHWQVRTRLDSLSGQTFAVQAEYATEVGVRGHRVVLMSWILGGVGFALVAAFAAWRLDREFLVPLLQLEQHVALTNLKGDDAAPPLPTRGAPEIKSLVRSFDRLMAKAEQDWQEIVRLSRTDALTGVANRRVFDEAIAQECDRAQRLGGQFALLMIDVDFFKRYNDHYGHPAGDEVLKHLAQALTETFARRLDLVARYGGEEFVVLLPGLDDAHAEEAASRALQAVRDLHLPHAASEIGPELSISVGVAVMKAQEQPEQVTERADEALYAAKHGGRDRAVLAG